MNSGSETIRKELEFIRRLIVAIVVRGKIVKQADIADELGIDRGNFNRMVSGGKKKTRRKEDKEK